MRFHVVGLPYVPTCRRYSACAFTSRAFKFCAQMKALGHTVYHYGVEGSDPECDAHFPIYSQALREAAFGPENATKVCYATKPVSWRPGESYWQEFNRKAAYWIRRNIEQGDFVCLIGGNCQKQIIDELADVQAKFIGVEYGIGYIGSFLTHRVFDSYAHMHQTYGRESAGDPNGGNGRNFDAVIPCPYYLEDFTFNEMPQDYCVFVGRAIARKGLNVAVEATRRAGVRLKICGQGVAKQDGAHAFHTEDGGYYQGDHIEHVGHVDAAQRDEILGNARAILVPTEYIEPFGGVNVEAQLCGTPAITTDWGGFTETVEHGVSGYRCRTLEQWAWAIANAPALNRRTIANRARRRYSMHAVGQMYEEYFSMLHTLWGDGWYADKARSNLDWLKG